MLRNGLLRYILLHMSKPVMQPVFKVLRNGLLRCILYTFATDPSSIWHVHTWSMRRNIDIHTPSTQGRWTTWLNLRHTNARAPSCDMIDAAECSMQIQNFDMRQRNAKSCESTDASNAQTCDKVRVQSGTQWCASVIRLPKCVVTIVFKRLRHGCGSVHTLHMSKPCYAML